MRVRVSMKSVVTYWGLWRYRPHCLRCGWEVSRWEELERSHLLASVYGGHGYASNLVPACRECNLATPGRSRDAALAWYRDGHGEIARLSGHREHTC